MPTTPCPARKLSSVPATLQLLGHLAQLLHNQAGHLHPLRLEVLRRHPVIPDQWISEREQLSGERRISEHLLVAGHASAEDRLPQSSTTCPYRYSFKSRPIVQDEYCSFQLRAPKSLSRTPIVCAPAPPGGSASYMKRLPLAGRLSQYLRFPAIFVCKIVLVSTTINPRYKSPLSKGDASSARRAHTMRS